ncbi:MAG TPA: di-heme oxidoredictase family protein [Pyrinomonadaceae bacterium]|nr:di-heme oxidoredictase family protein [Pyrinomonadaceae bacterium]
MKSGNRLSTVKISLIGLCVLTGPWSANLRSQVSFKEPDIARVTEGNQLTPGTAQFLINREGFARDAIQIGRSMFHHDFARDDKSGCNGVPCKLRDAKATRAWPQSQFEAGSCDTCHSTPRGSAGFGPQEQNTFKEGNTIRSNDMFGGGLIQQLATEATEDLQRAEAHHLPHVTANNVNYDGGLSIRDGGSVNADLVVRPFGRKGVESHLRAFGSRAAFGRLGLQAQDRFQCPAGDKNGDGRCDGDISVGLDPDNDGITDELMQGSLSILEHYLINYPVPGTGPITREVTHGEQVFKAIGCSECHRPEMRVRQDPRIEHITVFWNDKTNRFEAERLLLYRLVDDGYVDPDRQRPVPLVVPNRRPFVVPLYADLRRHEMGPRMADARDESGVKKSVFLTRPLWGVGSYTTFLDDGSAPTLKDAILRHGGEALRSRNRFARLSKHDQDAILKFLKSRILFSVEDVLTAKIPITRGDLP